MACVIDWTVTAAWVQAVGSIAAIAAVFFIDRAGARRALVAADAARAESEQRRSAEAAVVATTVRAVVRRIAVRGEIGAQSAAVHLERARSTADDYVLTRADRMIVELQIREDLGPMLPLLLVLGEVAGIATAQLNEAVSEVNATIGKRLTILSNGVNAQLAFGCWREVHEGLCSLEAISARAMEALQAEIDAVGPRGARGI